MIGDKTIIEFLFGKAAQDYDSLRIFGCPAYYHVKKTSWILEERNEFFGSKRGVKGYKIWDPKH